MEKEKMEKEKGSVISIIVPVYNSEKYLRECLDSIIAQTYKNIEIILIDDGSYDKSGSICDEYMGKDNRVKVIHKKNEGASKARNTGINLATGKYIQFVDSDDILEEGYCERLLFAIEKSNAEMGICSYQNFTASGTKKQEFLASKDENMVFADFIGEFIKMSPSLFMGNQCNRIYRTDIIIKNGICYDSGITYAEDFIFNVKYMQYVNVVSNVKEILYNYRQDSEGSLSKRAYALKTMWERYNEMYEILEKLLLKRKLFHAYEEEMKGFFARLIRQQLKHIRTSHLCTFREKMQFMNQLRREARVQWGLKDISLMGLSRKTSAVPILLFKYHMGFLLPFVYFFYGRITFLRREN